MAEIEDYYERYWDAPEDYNDPTVAERRALLRRHLGSLAKGARVLDVGCGKGEFCDYFATQGFEAVGSDLSTKAIEYARGRFPAVQFFAGPVEGLLPQMAGAFDAVFSSEVIEHLFDVGAFLRSVNRLMRPGALLALTTPFHGKIKNVVLDLLNYAGHYNPLGQHIRFFDKRSLGRVLRATGFEPFVWTGYGRPWPFWKSFFVVARKVREVTDQDAAME
ncbi:MAG TPA: class I SAM-dependent methyltransferase [Tepidisphaeraceae bacterium]|nr:class I SAM-dependent methyltransferase [Tepidisphaeraceae bacterium]